MIPDALRRNVRAVVSEWPLFRLNEAYLNYAEAKNEVDGPGVASSLITPTAENNISPVSAYDAVNIIRRRAGMPLLPPGLSKDEFRQRVRNERDIEMAYENHRFWDIRRWLIAEEEGVMRGKFYGIEITKNAGKAAGADDEFRYRPFIFRTRSFNKNMYLHPFVRTEFLKGGIVQNPGWQ
jgi:hypothetical protein